MKDIYSKYLGHKHVYTGLNCITLISEFYKRELNSDVFDSLFSYLKNNNKEINSRRWMQSVSFEDIDRWAVEHAVKVNLTNAQDYDVIIFKSEKYSCPIHFGLYIYEMKMLHVEEGSHSMITPITDYWLDKIYAIYRRKMV